MAEISACPPTPATGCVCREPFAGGVSEPSSEEGTVREVFKSLLLGRAHCKPRGSVPGVKLGICAAQTTHHAAVTQAQQAAAPWVFLGCCSWVEPPSPGDGDQAALGGGGGAVLVRA